jgi:acetyl esterase/lipase
MRLLIAMVLSLTLAGCTSAGLLLVNVPAWFGPYERLTDIAYGDVADQKLDVYWPAAAANTGAGKDSAKTDGSESSVLRQPLPVVVFFHGGSWAAGSREEYRFVGSALTELGFIAVLPDYRLYPAVRFPAFIDDAAAAVAWTIRNAAGFGGDPDRIFVMGHSAGAHLAALVALDPQYLAGQGFSPAQVRGLIGLSGPYDFDLNSSFLRRVFANADAASAEAPPETQPVNFARADAPPMLLIHGSADRIVRPRNATSLADAIRRAGSHAETQVYAGLGHGATVAALSPLRREAAPVLADIAAFVARH